MRCWKSPVNIQCRVILLDQQEFSCDATDKTVGKEILYEAFRRIGIHESAYFGLRYIDDTNQTQWLDLSKAVCRQVKGQSCTFYFGVKFYVVDPCKLNHESTRYQFFLQLKQDILQGRIPVNFDLSAELGAYVVQSELGDFDARRHTPGYVSEFRFIANQTVELENRIALVHTELTGQQPALAELNFLEKVKWLEMYGVDLHPVLGEDNNEYFLGLSPTGVIVLRNKTKVATYSWSRIFKIYHKGKYFMIRVTENKNNEENTYGFETPSKAACKHLFKCSVDLREFFKSVQSDQVESRGRLDDFDLRGSQQFVRVPSKRFQRRAFDTVQPTSLDSADTIIDRIKSSAEPKSLPSDWVRSESPKSFQSLPQPPTRGLYSSNSRISSSRRSVSMESRSSNESKSFVSSTSVNSRKRGSDSESEISKASGKSRRRRARSKRSSTGHKEKRGAKQDYVLVDSKQQWKEAQKKQAENPLVQEARVISPSRPKSEGGETHGTGRRRHRKHSHYISDVSVEQSPPSSGISQRISSQEAPKRSRPNCGFNMRSRSRSPGESKKRLPDELKRHLHFNLVDTAGMSENQLREIPYTVVETSSAKAVKVKLAPIKKAQPVNGARVATRRPV